MRYFFYILGERQKVFQPAPVKQLFRQSIHQVHAASLSLSLSLTHTHVRNSMWKLLLASHI